MDPSQLEVFLVVAEELHFGRAAERLHLVQPHLSRTIRVLEADLGMRCSTGRPGASSSRRRDGRCWSPGGDPADGGARRADVAAAHRGNSGHVRFSFAGPSSQVMVGRLARKVRER